MSGRVRYLLYADDGRFVRELAAVVQAEMAWGEHGPESATLVVPKYLDDGSLNPGLHHTVLAPGGRGALIEIDAREIDNPIPHVFLGRAKTAPDSGDAGTVSITVDGPWSWLGRTTIPAQRSLKASAGRIIREIVTTFRGPLRLDPGTFHEGPGVDIDLNGSTFWDTATALEDLTNDRLYLTAQPRRCRLTADWNTQLGRRFEETIGVVLTDGENCVWTGSDNDLDPDLETLVAVGQSFGAGAGVQAIATNAPRGPLLGKLAALTAPLTSAVVAAFGGGGGQTLRPDLATKSALEAAAEAHLRRGFTVTAVTTLRLSDLALREVLRPGCLVTVVLPTDALGYFRRSVAQVQAITYGLEPDETVDIGVELWAMAGEAD